MRFYTVHEPRDPPGDRVDRAERLIFVRDGFSWSTYLFAPFVLLGRRLYLGFACWLAALTVIVLSLAAIDANSGWISIALSALNAVFAFEVSQFERAKLARGGATMLGTVSGRTIEECERRFIDQWLSNQPMVRMASHSVDGSGSGRRDGWRRVSRLGFDRLFGTRRVRREPSASGT